MATAYNWAKVSAPNAAATGTEPMISIRATSHQIISHRLARRSTMAPAGRAISANGRVAAAVSAPTWKVEAWSTTTAVSGSASWVTAEPVSLTVCPLHRSRKLRFRQSVRPGSSPGMGSTLPGPCQDCPTGRRACDNGFMAAMKVTTSAAMRARDVSRPHAEHLADAEAAEAAAVRGRPAAPAAPAPVVPAPAAPAPVVPAPAAPAPAVAGPVVPAPVVPAPVVPAPVVPAPVAQVDAARA